MHHAVGWIESALVVIAAAVIIVPLVQKLKFSPVLGYLIAGILIGPHALNLIQESKTQEQLAEIGVVFLLFTLGLELSVERLRALRGYIFGLGAAQVGLTALIFYGFMRFLGLESDAAIVIGAGLALSSTAAVINLLTERREMITRMGRVTFSILLFQDLAVAPLLALVPLLGQGDMRLFTVEAALAVGTALAALVGIVVVGRFLLRPALRAVAVSQNRELFIGIVLMIALGTGWATQLVGLSMALGAFLAGLMVSETEYRHQVQADIEPFRGILLGLFFITVGMLIDLPLLIAQIELVLLGVVLLIGGKWVILFGLSRAIGLPETLSIRVAFNLCQSGEFAFALFALAIAQGVLAADVGSLLIVIVAVTIAATPSLAGIGEKVATRLSKARHASAASLEEEMGELSDHVIIAGFGRVGRLVAKMMADRNVPYVAFEIDPAQVAAARADGWQVYFGDVSRADLFERANIKQAAAIVITVDQAHTAHRLTSQLRHHHPKLHIVARAVDLKQAGELSSAGADHIVLEALEAGLELSRSLLCRLGMADSEVSKAVARIREEENWEQEISTEHNEAVEGSKQRAV